MTTAPPTLVALGRYWVSQGGTNLGVVGDVAHQRKGTSYHLGADQLAPGAYSATTARDVAGLTNAASAIDLGRLDGSLEDLRTFSRWLVAEGQRNAPGTVDIREIIYSPDGKTVLRWDRERGYGSLPRTGEADASHLTHTHVSYYRDSRTRPKIATWAGYFVPKPVEDGVTVVTIEKFPTAHAFTATAGLRRFSATEELSPIPLPYSATVDGTALIEGNPSAPTGAGFLRLASGGSAGKYILVSEVDLA